MSRCKKRITLLLAITLFSCLSVAQSAQGASFACAKAQTQVEHLICDEAVLSALDNELNAAYNAALKDGKLAKGIRQSQRQWLEWRNRCAEAACVKWAYEARILYMKDVAVLSKLGILGDYPASYSIDRGVGKDEPFCEAIVAALNKAKPTTGQLPCISEELLKIPGVIDPAWEKLDLSQHEELAKKVMTAATFGADEYFREKKFNPKNYPTPEQQQRSLEEVKKSGAELFALKLAPEFFSDQVMVALRFKDAMCGWQPTPRAVSQHNERVDVAWANADLKELANDPGFSTIARPTVYQGKLYFAMPFGTNRGLNLWVPNHKGFDSICTIVFSVDVNSKGDAK